MDRWPALLLVVFIGVPAHSETVYIPVGQQAQEKQGLERPRQGMSKTQVEQQFGQPQRREDAVGHPPISSWVYKDFTVYFEHQHVIHSVLRLSLNSP
ncbi:MAG: hypothetical protein KTR20_00405 [Cellvibrionaceae bacterium]|nr:hypothetical protein [Cellvibrionaceae bacterium]